MHLFRFVIFNILGLCFLYFMLSCLMNRNMLQEQEHWGLEEAEEDDDDEPIFVLTDEWREFFAKSEAKRKLGPLLLLLFLSMLCTWKFCL